MKKSLYNSILLPVLVAILLIAGCEPADFNYSKEVVFTAATGYDNLPGTKTVYTGTDVTVDGKPYELIDWVAGDQIRVMAHNVKTAANNPSAEYAVQSANINQHSGRNSTATVAKVGDGLSWSSTTATSDTFYAIYPSPTKNANASISVGTSNATIGGTIPATQNYTTHTNASAPDMDNAYMWAAKTASAGSTINLEFQPAFTAFQITINNNTGKGLKINSLKLTSSSMAINGSFTGTISASANPSFGGFPTASSTNKEISVTGLPSSAIADGSSASVTLFALPRDLQNMSIKMNVTSDGQTVDKTLDLKKDGSFMTFDKCKKYRINVGAPAVEEPWTYVVEDIDNITLYGHLASPNNAFTVKSYRKRGTGSSAEYEAVKWKVQYATSASGPWSDTQPTGWQTNGAKFSISNTSGNGSLPSVGESNAANVLRDHTTTETETGEYYDSEQAAIATMRARGTLPSTTSDAGDGYFDLSKHPIYPVSAIDGAEIARETANCYVITRPGKYKFPLVYGNAIRNGSTNQKAYAPTASDASNYYLRNFVRHDNQPITDPWLKNNGATPTSAVVVWQDVKDMDHRILLEGSSDLFIDGDYVKFEIKSENIRPGNILIAVKKGSDIVWSWHIWVTEKDLSPHNVTDKNSQTHGMMGYNLGWTDKGTVKGNHWDDWKFYVRIVQTDDGGNVLSIGNPMNENTTGAADVFSVIQYGESITVDANVGSNCFYQWGRKDPILPATTTGDHTTSINKHYYSSTYSDITESNTKVTTETNSGGFGYSIKNPYKILYTRPSYQYHSSNYYGNLWDVDLIAHKGTTENSLSVNNRLPIKSVYDPSPRGYVVPYTFAFTGFSQQAWNVNNHGAVNGAAATDGINFSDGNGGYIYFPYSGARGGDGVTPLYDVTNTMYYWTTGKLPHDDGSNQKSKNLTCLGMSDIRAIWDQYSEGAYAVRPVLETTSSPSITGEGIIWD